MTQSEVRDLLVDLLRRLDDGHFTAYIDIRAIVIVLRRNHPLFDYLLPTWQVRLGMHLVKFVRAA